MLRTRRRKNNNYISRPVCELREFAAIGKKDSFKIWIFVTEKDSDTYDLWISKKPGPQEIFPYRLALLIPLNEQIKSCQPNQRRFTPTQRPNQRRVTPTQRQILQIQRRPSSITLSLMY